MIRYISTHYHEDTDKICHTFTNGKEFIVVLWQPTMKHKKRVGTKEQAFSFLKGRGYQLARMLFIGRYTKKAANQ